MGCYEQCVLREKEGLLAKSSGESFAILQGRSLRRALFFSVRNEIAAAN